jgi:RNA polymerase sigma-70 factor, ECF subfamily
MVNQLHKSPSQLEEEAHLIALAQKDTKKFEPLYNAYFEKIFCFVYQRVESKDEAGDITSQVFLKALLNLGKYTFRSLPFSAWLYRIAINEISSYYTNTKKSRVVNIQTAQLGILFEEANEELREDRIEEILNAVKYLDSQDLLLIEMRFFEEKPFKEIAEILGISENNAKVRLYRVLDKLKQKIF